LLAETGAAPLLVWDCDMYDFQVYEALLRLLREQNRRLRQSAEALGVEAERLSDKVRDARRTADPDPGPRPEYPAKNQPRA
jgi:hypothetical protein